MSTKTEGIGLRSARLDRDHRFIVPDREEDRFKKTVSSD